MPSSLVKLPLTSFLKLKLTVIGFQWNSLPEGSVIVDVGGGIGSSSLIIAQANPNINIVVQDRAVVVESAQQAGFITCHFTLKSILISFSSSGRNIFLRR